MILLLLIYLIIFERITKLNNFIYEIYLEDSPFDNSNMLHMTQQMPMLSFLHNDDTSSQIKATIRESDNKSDYFDNLRF